MGVACGFISELAAACCSISWLIYGTTEVCVVTITAVEKGMQHTIKVWSYRAATDRIVVEGSTGKFSLSREMSCFLHSIHQRRTCQSFD